MREPVRMEVMAIVHGKSEYRICQSIKSNLRLKHAIIGRNNGENNIQVTSIMDILNDRRFKTFKGFIREFSDVAYNKSKLQNFTLFIIMDVDDCTEKQKEDFISKKMFADHWLWEYIYPIYNDPELETTMRQAKINIQRKKDYFIIFPTNHGDLDMNMAKDFQKRLEACKHSNLSEYVKCCIAIAQRRI